MNAIIETIFKNKKANFKKILEYGFSKIDEMFVYRTQIVDGQMDLSVRIDNEGKIFTDVVDLATNESFTLFLVADAKGAFVGKVKKEYEEVMADIADKCFDIEVFKSIRAKKTIDYIRNELCNELEFLWEKFPNTAIWRRKDNRKWYGILCSIPKRKLGLDSDEIVEVIVLRIQTEKIEEIVDNESFFYGYHMNKKHWMTISLEGKAEMPEIINRINDSYQLAKK